MNKEQEYVDRFHSLVDAQDQRSCWRWLGPVNSKGYGAARRLGGQVLAHRFAYELANGPIATGSVVRHACDNRRCVNPAHLLTGSFADNTRDALERDRFAIGSRHGNAVLDEEKVLEVFRLRAAGLTQRAVADRFGVSASAIGEIERGRNWKHVKNLEVA